MRVLGPVLSPKAQVAGVPCGTQERPRTAFSTISCVQRGSPINQVLLAEQRTYRARGGGTGQAQDPNEWTHFLPSNRHSSPNPIATRIPSMLVVHSHARGPVWGTRVPRGMSAQFRALNAVDLDNFCETTLF